MTGTATTPNYEDLRQMISDTTSLLFTAALIHPDYQTFQHHSTDDIRVFSNGRVFNAGVVPDPSMGYVWENDDYRRSEDPDAMSEVHFTDDLTEVRGAFMNWAARSVIAGG